MVVHHTLAMVQPVFVLNYPSIWQSSFNYKFEIFDLTRSEIKPWLSFKQNCNAMYKFFKGCLKKVNQIPIGREWWGGMLLGRLSFPPARSLVPRDGKRLLKGLTSVHVITPNRQWICWDGGYYVIVVIIRYVDCLSGIVISLMNIAIYIKDIYNYFLLTLAVSIFF